MTDKPDRLRAAEIVRDAGGQIVGRTRLQKVACLLQLAGYETGFHFEYYHYGPYAEELTDAIRMAAAFDLVEEEEKRASWGGLYSVFKAKDIGPAEDAGRARLAEMAAKVDAVELELAVTAAYLAATEAPEDAWAETARRKPDKGTPERLEKAKAAYREFLGLRTPKDLPAIV